MVSRRSALALFSLSVSALAGCNTIERTARDEPVKDIRDFGAAVDGTTDDTTAVRDAIDAVDVGGDVYFPPGTTLVSADDKSEVGARAVEVLGDELPDDVTFRGDGEESIIRLGGGHQNNHGVFVWRPQDGISGHVVRDLTVDGNRDEQPADPDDDDNGLNLAIGEAAHDDAVVDVTFENVWSVDANTEGFTLRQGGCVANRCTATGSGKHGFGIDSQGKTGPVSPPIRVQNCYATECRLYGIDCSGGTIVVEDSVFENNGWGTKTTGQAFDVTYRRVRLTDNDTLGYQRNDTPSETGSRATVTFDAVIAAENGHQGFRLGRDTDYDIESITARGNNTSGSNSGNIAVMDNARMDATEIRSCGAVNGAGIHYWSSLTSTISKYVNADNADGAVNGEAERLTIRSVGIPNGILEGIDADPVPHGRDVGAGTPLPRIDTEAGG